MIITANDWAVARAAAAELKKRQQPARMLIRSDSTLYTLEDGSRHTLASLAQKATYQTYPSNIKRKIEAGMTPDEAIKYRSLSAWKAAKSKQAQA